MDRIQKVLHTMCKRVATPLAHHVSDLASRGMWLELQRLEIDPTGYTDSHAYWCDAMCIDLIRKAALPGSDTELAAVNKFLETERDCWRTNQRVRNLQRKPVSDMTQPEQAALDILVQWREKIRTVMGRIPESIEPRFSTGATTTHGRDEATILDKLSMTPEFYQHGVLTTNHLTGGTLWEKAWHETGIYPRSCRSNDYFVVPKNGLTGRSCCKEAPINLAFQLGVGNIFRRRLMKTLQIDLNHGAELHRRRARESSLNGEAATLDMSSASDRWARELVRYLLSFGGWGTLLDDLRATHTSFGGKNLYLEKFSSMGNGFTFELETILFVTLAYVVAEREGITGEILCYGDDLIVPVALAMPLCTALEAFGHRVNQSKSFWEGSFRESCGGDFFNGVPVSTAKLEEIPREPQQWISLANNLRRVCASDPRRWALIKPVWDEVLRNLPIAIRECRGPAHLGDLVIHDRPPPDGWPAKVRSYQPIARHVPLRGYGRTGDGQGHDLNRYPGSALVGSSLKGLLICGGKLPLLGVDGYRLRWIESARASRWLPGTRFRVPYDKLDDESWDGGRPPSSP